MHLNALEQSLQEIIERHEALRTMFTIEDNTGVQQILQDVQFHLDVVDLERVQESERESEMLRLAGNEATRPIDLEHDLKLRVGLIRLRPDEHVVVFTLHHISSDAWSFSIFFRELTAFYEQITTGNSPSSLPSLRIDYVDYACWQQTRLQSDSVQAQIEYWENQLAGMPSLLQLPTDKPRPALQTYHGETHIATFSSNLTTALRSLAQQEGATLFMVLLAAFQTLLYRYTGQNDVTVGTPVAGRNHPDIGDVVGFFINTLVLRTDLSGGITFREALGRVRTVALRAYDNQDVPFEKLVEKLQPARNLSHSPLFQVMFILQNTLAQEFNLPGLTVTQLMDVNTGTSKYDLSLSMMERPDGLWAVFEYNPDLFNRTTMQRMAGHLETLLEEISLNPSQRIVDIPILKTEEQHQILVEWNQTKAEVEPDCIHLLFEKQVLQTPKKTALRWEGQSLTYAELNERANQLARYLIGLGIQPEMLVGICMERSLDMVVALMAVLKAGAAYVPLDPAFPSDRLAFMQEDSQASVFLTQQPLCNQIVISKEIKTVCVDSDWEMIKKQSTANPPVRVRPENLAYVIYTSGSTGKPKGVQIEHHSVVNFLLSMQARPGITEKDVLLSVTTLSFDIAGLEIYLPLITGAQMELVSRETATDGASLRTAIEESGATIMQATPVTWRMLIEAGWLGSPQLKILCGGEALALDLAQQIRRRCKELWNMYGPTETTIWSTISQIQADDTEVSIGRPIANTECYVLDTELSLFP